MVLFICYSARRTAAKRKTSRQPVRDLHGKEQKTGVTGSCLYLDCGDGHGDSMHFPVTLRDCTQKNKKFTICKIKTPKDFLNPKSKSHVKEMIKDQIHQKDFDLKTCIFLAVARTQVKII